MPPATRSWIVGEYALDRTLVLHTKTTIHRLAAEKGIDLDTKRVSLWHPYSPQEF